MQVGISHLRLITSAMDLHAVRTIRMQTGIQKHRGQQESSQMKKNKASKNLHTPGPLWAQSLTNKYFMKSRD